MATTREAIASLEAKVKAFQEAAEKYPAIAGTFAAQQEEAERDLARLREDLTIEESLAEVGKNLPVDIDKLSNVLFRKVAVKDADDKVTGWTWEPQINVTTQVAKTGGNKGNGESKRRIHVTKVEIVAGSPVVKDFGVFKDATEACEKLGIDIKGDSAVRKLRENGYTTIPA